MDYINLIDSGLINDRLYLILSDEVMFPRTLIGHTRQYIKNIEILPDNKVTGGFIIEVDDHIYSALPTLRDTIDIAEVVLLSESQIYEIDQGRRYLVNKLQLGRVYTQKEFAYKNRVEALSINGKNIKYFLSEKNDRYDNSYEKLCMIAVKTNGDALENIPDASVILQHMAVAQDPFAIRFVDGEHQTSLMCQMALLKEPKVISYIHPNNRTRELCNLAYRLDHATLPYFSHPDLSELSLLQKIQNTIRYYLQWPIRSGAPI